MDYSEYINDNIYLGSYTYIDYFSKMTDEDLKIYSFVKYQIDCARIKENYLITFSLMKKYVVDFIKNPRKYYKKGVPIQPWQKVIDDIEKNNAINYVDQMLYNVRI